LIGLAEKVDDNSCQSEGTHAGDRHHRRRPADKFAALNRRFTSARDRGKQRLACSASPAIF
jgi:hypothetical protein